MAEMDFAFNLSVPLSPVQEQVYGDDNAWCDAVLGPSQEETKLRETVIELQCQVLEMSNTITYNAVKIANLEAAVKEAKSWYRNASTLRDQAYSRILALEKENKRLEEELSTDETKIGRRLKSLQGRLNAVTTASRRTAVELCTEVIRADQWHDAYKMELQNKHDEQAKIRKLTALMVKAGLTPPPDI